MAIIGARELMLVLVHLTGWRRSLAGYSCRRGLLHVRMGQLVGVEHVATLLVVGECARVHKVGRAHHLSVRIHFGVVLLAEPILVLMLVIILIMSMIVIVIRAL